jgi:hypothetical protein
LRAGARRGDAFEGTWACRDHHYGHLKTYTAQGSLLVRNMLTELSDQLSLVYTPAYDPDANRIEWLWHISRRNVTHNHHRSDLSRGFVMAERTSRRSPIPLMTYFVISAVLLRLTSVLSSHRSVPHDQLGSI